jgi:His-Xaa-Ser system protein HxsD
LSIPGISTDQFGDLATIEIDTALYGEVPVFKAAYWFTDRFYVYLARSGAEAVVVELRHKGEGPAQELSRALSEFCNSLIDFKLRQDVPAGTGASATPQMRRRPSCKSGPRRLHWGATS